MTIYYQYSKSMGEPTREYILRNGAGTLQSFGVSRNARGRVVCNEVSFDLTADEQVSWTNAKKYAEDHAFDVFSRLT